MKTGNKIRPLYGPSEDDFVPDDSSDFLAEPWVPASEKVVPFNQPLDAIAMGMRLAQVLPMLQQLSQQVSDVTAEVKVLKAYLSSLPQSSAADDVGWLDAEGARRYLSMSKNTFEKYVYSGKIKVKKYLVGGKNLFKKKDLDLFVMTWEDKNLGFA